MRKARAINFINLLLILLLAQVAFAAPQITWTNAGGSNIASDSANWSGSVKPQNGDAAIFDGTSIDNCTWDYIVTLDSLFINSNYSGTLTIDADLSTTGNVDILGGSIILNSGTLLIGATIPTGLPSVTTDSADNINGHAVTLNSTVNPNGSETTVHFEWGVDTNYGDNTLPQVVGSGMTSIAVSDAITVLSMNTTYHYRVVATNEYGTNYGDDVSFTTAGGTTVQGTISTDTTWTFAGSPYMVTGNLFVYGTSEPTLTIEPGVVVQFSGNYYLKIGQYPSLNGILNAQGTALNPIIFTSTNSTINDWYGIQFNNHPATESVLNYVTVEYAGNYTGAINVSHSSPTINNSIIRNNGNTGIYIGGNSSPSISSTSFTNNGSYPLSLEAGSAGNIGAGNSASGNGTDGIELRGSTISSDMTLSNGSIPYIITGNLSVYGDRKSTRLNSSHIPLSRMPSSA